VYDTRDNEAAPDRGMWSELLLLTAPTFLGNHPYAFVKLAIAHRQYISLVRKRLVAAFHLSYQGTLGGSTPWYILPYIYSSYSLDTKPDGLGGARTIRGCSATASRATAWLSATLNSGGSSSDRWC